MKIAEVVYELVGKSVTCKFLGEQRSGTIIKVIDNIDAGGGWKGVRIEFDKSLEIGEHTYYTSEFTAAKCREEHTADIYGLASVQLN